ncbi:hypothetical protein [Arthrobacter sp. 3Tela_A]|uniref:hypothetical protein n=1 Tax=Arthrobacter sp. 3Tela_A TaxID=3093743 RepID=UPI003BB55A08
MIWAAIGAAGLLAGFISVNVAKRRSLRNMNNDAASAGTGTAAPQSAEQNTVPETVSARAASQPEPASESYARTPSSRSGRRLTHAGL